MQRRLIDSKAVGVCLLALSWPVLADLFGPAVSQLVEDHLTMSVTERRERGVAQQAFWALPTKNTRDRETAILPRLLYERMDEMGLDFSIMYPTIGAGLPMLPDPEPRQAACRAFNIFSAEYFAEFTDRITPVAVIPMHTPEEAIAEIEYATRQLGLKCPCLAASSKDKADRPWIGLKT